MRLSRISIAVALLIAAICLPVIAGTVYPLKIKDARGKTVTIQAKPARIVSLAPNLTEIVFALGAGNRLVGVTKYCNYPPAALKVPKVGDMTASAESVLSRKPDLVLAHAFLNSQLISKLEGLRLVVFALDPKTLAQVQSDIITIGKITDRFPQARSISKKMAAEIKSVAAARANKKPESVLVVIQANPLWAAGPRTFIDEMLRTANAKNIAYDARPGFVPFSKELAISRNPDVIIVGSEADRMFFLTSPTWKNTRAAKSSRVYVINNDLLVRPGPRLIKGLKEIANKLR